MADLIFGILFLVGFVVGSWIGHHWSKPAFMPGTFGRNSLVVDAGGNFSLPVALGVFLAAAAIIFVVVLH
jgi:hypothetical protein